MKLDLQTILDMWKVDVEIDEMNLDEASRQTPNLHAKYLELYSLSKLQLKKAEMNQKSLLKDKWLWYNGKMDQTTINQKGWKPDPFDGLSKPLKTDMDRWYDSDSDIQQSEELVSYYKTIVDTLKEIVDNIKWRHQTIKNMVEWRKFTSGG